MAPFLKWGKATEQTEIEYFPVKAKSIIYSTRLNVLPERVPP